MSTDSKHGYGQQKRDEKQGAVVKRHENCMKGYRDMRMGLQMGNVEAGGGQLG